MSEIKNKLAWFKNLSIWLLLFIFALSGIMQGGLFGRNLVIAYVGNIAIKPPEVRSFMQMLSASLPQGVDPSSDEAQQYLFEQAKIMLIKRALLTNECNKLGLIVADEKVIETIKNDRQFFVDGRFSRAKFLEFLSKIGFSEMEYKKLQKENLLHQQYIFMLKNAYVVPDQISETAAKAFSQKRNGRYALIDRSKIAVPKIGQRELENFYNDNLNLFKIPAKKVFKILIFNNNRGISKINKLLEKQKFDQIEEKKFGALSIMSDAEPAQLNALVPQSILKQLDNLPLEKGKNSQLYSFSKKYYAVKLINIIPELTPKFGDIKKSVVYKAYADEYRKKNVKPSNWINISGVQFGSFYLGVPSVVANEIFLNPVGKLTRKDYADDTYFIIVDSIFNSKPTLQEVNQARNGIHDELLYSVLQAVLNSLELKYKIRVMF